MYKNFLLYINEGYATTETFVLENIKNYAVIFKIIFEIQLTPNRYFKKSVYGYD